MEIPGIIALALAAAVLVVVLAILFLTGRLGGRRREMSRAGLSRRASGEAESLRDLVEERESSRPTGDSVIRDHDLPSRRVTVHDEGTREIYLRDHLPEVADLRRQLGERGVRDETLDSLYEAAENGSDLRTVSTALFEMARRLRPRLR
ncbi:MAG: hypothetical protein M3494_00625 [Actinomycetota bacterium]|jgi:hypothetical protein|nr:hypothetical protein [Rubrobacter sp.]MDQ3506516.1 hypothetical protein [Actinomycetota bacterium]